MMSEENMEMEPSKAMQDDLTPEVSQEESTANEQSPEDTTETAVNTTVEDAPATLENSVDTEVSADAEESVESEESDKLDKSEESEESVELTGADESAEENQEDQEDQEGQEEENQQIELPDLNELTSAQLIQLAKDLMQERGLVELKRPMDLIRQRFYLVLKEEWSEKQDEFIESGGEAADFVFDQPEKTQFGDLYGLYRDELSKHIAEEERKLKANLRRREQIIEAIDALTFSEEPDEVTHQRFRELQAEWKEIGPVPRGASSSLYRSYHFHLEKYFDNKIKLNWAFRDMEFQRNLELKQELVQRAESLLKEKSINKAMDELQVLHRIWKEDTGPVAPEQREVVWDAFSAATKALHDRRQAHLDELKEKWAIHAETKRVLIEALATEAQQEHNSHSAWQKAQERVHTLNDQFRSAGPVSRKENDTLWNDWRENYRAFNQKKNAFYKGLKESYQANIDQRNQLIARAEELAVSDQWKDTAKAIQKLQEEWKSVGPVPAGMNQKTWKAFQSACNSFFDRRKAHFAERDAEFESNYQQKAELLEQVEKYELSGDRGKDTKALSDWMKAFKQVGFVPRDKMGIDAAFKKAVDLKFSSLKIDKRQRQKIDFNTKLEAMADGGSAREINREEQQIRNLLNAAKSELRQLEGNLTLFSTSSSKNPLLAMAEKSVQEKKNEIEVLTDRLKQTLSVKNELPKE